MNLAEDQKLVRHMHHVGERVFAKFENWPLIVPCNGPLTIIKNELFRIKSGSELYIYANVHTDRDDITHLDLPLSIYYKYVSINMVLLTSVRTPPLIDLSVRRWQLLISHRHHTVSNVGMKYCLCYGLS